MRTSSKNNTKASVCQLPATSRSKCRKNIYKRRLVTFPRFPGASRSHTHANTETPAAVIANFTGAPRKTGLASRHPPISSGHRIPAEGEVTSGLGLQNKTGEPYISTILKLFVLV